MIILLCDLKEYKTVTHTHIEGQVVSIINSLGVFTGLIIKINVGRLITIGMANLKS